MPTNDSLDLAKLDRLEQAAAEEAQRGDNIFARRQLDWACRNQLRPLLDLVDRMGVALEAATYEAAPILHCNSRRRWEKMQRALDDYRRAKGGSL